MTKHDFDLLAREHVLTKPCLRVLPNPPPAFGGGAAGVRDPVQLHANVIDRVDRIFDLMDGETDTGEMSLDR
jgi:hypothetical protein